MSINKLLLTACALVFSAGMSFAQDIQIEHQYARVSSPIAKSGASFMHIMNMGTEDDRLVSVTTDIATNPELHTHIMEDGVAKMREVEGGFVIPAGEAIMLERGGLHIMLMGLTQSLEQDQTVTLTLVFEKAGEITIDVPVDNERHGNMDMNNDNGTMDHGTMDHTNMDSAPATADN